MDANDVDASANLDTDNDINAKKILNFDCERGFLREKTRLRDVRVPKLQRGLGLGLGVGPGLGRLGLGVGLELGLG